MKKLLTALLVALSVTAVSKSALADGKVDTVWNLNLTSLPPVYFGPGVNWAGPSGGANDYWNFYAPSSPPVISNAQAQDYRGSSGVVGLISYSADAQSSPYTGGAPDNTLRGYIESTTGQGGITGQFNASATGITRGFIYTYTVNGDDIAYLQGASGTTMTLDTSYGTAGTWSNHFTDAAGASYDVVRYIVTTSTPGIANMVSTDTGRISAVQLTPVPEPNSAMLLGIGGLIGAVMLRRKYAVEA
jgi:hypothetical protein